MAKPQIMVVLHYIASPFWGGGEQYVYDLSKALTEQHAIRCVFVCQPGTPADLIDRWQQIGHVYCLHPKTKNGKFSYIEAIQLARILRREEVDVMHMHELKDFFLCAYAKLFCIRPVRLIATRHIIGAAKNKVSWRWVYRQIDAMIFNSKLTSDTFLVQPAVQRALPHTHIVRNSIRVPHDETNLPTLREQYGIADTLPLVLYHGRVCREKGIVQLLQTMAPTFNRQYAIILAGVVNEDVREDLDQILHHSPMSGYVYPIGFRRDVANLIAQCQLGVLPSIVPEAGGPLTLLEHMALGSAVVASDNGSQPEYAENGKEAVLLPPGEWERWKDAIERLLTDRKAAQQIGEQAQNRFMRDFTYHSFVEKIYSIYANR